MLKVRISGCFVYSYLEQKKYAQYYETHFSIRNLFFFIYSMFTFTNIGSCKDI